MQKTFFAFFAVVAIAPACGGGVTLQSAAGAGGGTTSSASSSSSGGPSASSSSVASSAVASSGASSSGGMLPPRACILGEAILVTAGSNQRRVSAEYESAWRTGGASDPVLGLVAFVDSSRELGLLGRDAEGVPFVERGQEIESFATLYPPSWYPHGTLVAAPSSLGASFLDAAGAASSGVARFDPASQTMVLESAVSSSFFASGLAVDDLGGFAAIGRGAGGALCLSAALPNGSLQAPICDPSKIAVDGGEIPVSLPQIVSLPGGDLVAIYFSKAGAELSATTLHAGAWSPAVPLALANTVLSFATTRARGGEVVVALADALGGASFLRYAPATGWRGPFSIAGGFMSYEGMPIAAAPGACGDDAEIVFVAGVPDPEVPSQIVVARVQGDVGVAEVAAPFGYGVPNLVSIATRPATGG